MLGSYVQQQRLNMDLKKLLGKLDLLEGTMKSAEKQSTGPKFTGYWKGKNKGTPGSKMVGGMEESILKDLNKGPTPKTKEQELAEQYEAFLQALEEENLGVETKRPARKGSRPDREYTKDGKPSKRYHYNKEETDESRGHKILARKLKDIERQPSVPSADDDAKRAEQAKIDYAKYVAKMKKKDPNFVPLYKIDEYGADQPTGTAGQTSLAKSDPMQVAKVNQATNTLKAATQSTAPTTNIAKALDAASQGKAVGQLDMKAIQPIVQDLATVAQDPNLANQYRSLAGQINRVQAKQQKP